jgi:hypothetical protein
MPGLVHDRPLRCPSDCRARRMPGSQRVPPVLGRIQPGAFRKLFHDSRHARTGQPSLLQFSVPIKRSEHRPASYGRLLDPAL